ncbi:SDR family oxidoreductase [Brevundimonas sp.]|uniref:SDR family oxidoreductase n=1 Tax=Brevundimonas sp. TaxID=1871086 RepID=UPI001D657460|nr:SDR family oxidoreductase [Brevundimonas sp.]MBA3999470.1 short-chain dehydrogenase [Brevundimonas sp.]
MKFRPKSLDQQTIVITGASSGIGLATARQAVAEGAAVVLVARNEDALKTICDELREQGGRVAYAVADVGVEADVDGVVQTALREFGGFDTWVNDAGVGIYGDLMDIPIEEHERLFQTNYWGVVFGSKAAVQHFRTTGGGVVINIGSINSDFAIPLLSAYAASKHAVKGFTDGLRMELRHEGAPVSVTLIKPSGIGTPFPVHARNHMDSDPQVAPPVYAPEVVAGAILHAATHRVRDITVGASGRMMVGAAVLAPGLADRFFAWSMPKVQQTEKPRTEADSLFAHSDDGDMYRADKGPGRKFSVYTAAQKHPGAVAGAGLGLAALGAGAAVLLARRLSNGGAPGRWAA